MYETESDKFSFYTLLNLPLPDCSFYFVPLQVTNFYFNLIQFRMKQQKVIMFTYQTDNLDELNEKINSRIDKLNANEWRVVSISSCNSTIVTSGGTSSNQVTVFLLAEES